MNLCHGVHGYIRAGAEGYVITPAGGDVGLESEHEITRDKRDTGQRDSLTGDEEMFTWYDVDLDEEMAKQEEEFSNLEWEGYVADKVWQIDSAAARRRNYKQTGQTVCNGPYCQYFRLD